MTRIIHFIMASACLLFSVTALAQNTSKEKAVKALTDYFLLERENIHVQCNKSIYTTEEQIWFKGYVFHRKNNIPFFNTINVFANLIDESGTIIDTKLIYANIGSFTGSFKLNNTFKPGRYYLRFYTNWMNNFTEDESAVYEVAIINSVTGAGNALAKADLSKINIAISPEGGTLVNGITNIAGLHISNCNHEALEISTADLVDSGGKVLKQIQVNKLGYGRFEITPKPGEFYKIVTTLDGVNYEQAFTATATGIAIEVNSYTIDDKIMVTLQTPLATSNSTPLYLVIQKDDESAVYDVIFDNKGTAKLMIAKADISEGLNTLRLLDANLFEIGQRLFYNYPKEQLKTELTLSKKGVIETEFKGNVNYPNMNLSASILPEGTSALDAANDIYSSFLLLPYINTSQKANGRYYFTTLTKVKQYELDLYLMSQKSKYAWNNILSTPPKSNTTFDMGLTLKGTLPNPNKDDKYAQVRMYALTAGIDIISPVDEDGSFTFNNIIIPDSTHVNFTLLRKGQKPKQLTLSPQLLNGNRKFNKPYKPEQRCFAIVSEAKPIENIPLPGYVKGNTELDEIKIEANRLTHSKNFGNGNLTGYKITPDKSIMFQTLINFIASNSTFSVKYTSTGEVSILNRQRTSINAAQTGPIVYIDNVQQLDYSILSSYYMTDVDEVYIGAHTIVPSLRNYMGVIKIYLKKGTSSKVKDTTPDIIVKGGFEKMIPFENLLYNSTTDEGFVKFGIIDWQPQIMTDDKGTFNLKIPTTGQTTIKVVLEGFSADGKLVSEVKTLSLQ